MNRFETSEVKESMSFNVKEPMPAKPNIIVPISDNIRSSIIHYNQQYWAQLCSVRAIFAAIIADDMLVIYRDRASPYFHVPIKNFIEPRSKLPCDFGVL